MNRWDSSSRHSHSSARSLPISWAGTLLSRSHRNPSHARTSIFWQIRPQIRVALDKPRRRVGITRVCDIQEGAWLGVPHAKGHEVQGMFARQNDQVGLHVAPAASCRVARELPFSNQQPEGSGADVLFLLWQWRCYSIGSHAKALRVVCNGAGPVVMRAGNQKGRLCVICSPPNRGKVNSMPWGASASSWTTSSVEAWAPKYCDGSAFGVTT